MTVHGSHHPLQAAVLALLLVSCGGGSVGDSATSGSDDSADSTAVTTEDRDLAANSTGTTARETTGTPAVDAPGTLVQDRAQTVDAADVETYALSDRQLIESDATGPPDRFDINFFTEMLPDGTPVEIRHETWFYDALGTSIVYRNGDVFTERRDSTPLVIAGLGATPYRPEMFTAMMTLDELLAVTEQGGYYEIPVDPAIDGGTLVTVRGLLAGFEGGELRFVQTAPLEDI